MNEHDKQAIIDSLVTILDAGSAPDPGAPVALADAFFTYRILLRRNPDEARDLPHLVASRETNRAFLARLLGCEEFRRTGGYLPAGRTLMAEVEGFRFWFDTGDREMGATMALGTYEPESVSLFKEILRPGMRCLDLGAQTGFFTCLMASIVGRGGSVEAFEPMPANFRLLEKNVAENRYSDRVRLHRLASSDVPSTIEGSLLSNMFVGGLVEGGEPIRLECVPVDDVVAGPIDFVKIDIEGYEPKAIRGMERLIRRHRPIIVSECNEYWLQQFSGVTSGDYVEQLRLLGYDVFRVGDLATPIRGDSLHLGILETVDIIAFPGGQGRPTHAPA